MNACLSLPTFSTKEEYQELFFLRDKNNPFQLDSPSSMHRAVTICTVVASLDAKAFFLGFGPYVVGTIDNSILRIVADTGIFGLIIFTKFFLIATRDFNFLEKLALVVSLLFSDVFFAARFVPFLYLVHLLMQKNKIHNLDHN